MERTKYERLRSRVAALTADFRFRWLEPVSRSDTEAHLGIYPLDEEDGGPGMSIGLVCGPRLRPLLRGLRWVVRNIATGEGREGETDRRCHFRLHGLPDGEYRLEVQVLESEALSVSKATLSVPTENLGRVLALLAGERVAEGGRRLVVRLTAPDGRYRATLSESVGQVPRLVLRVDLAPELAGDCLLRAELRTEAGEDNRQLLIRGYMGLSEHAGRREGELALSLLRASDAVAVLASAPPPELFLTLEPVSPEDLGQGDRALLEESLRATNDPDSREALSQALKRLPSRS